MKRLLKSWVFWAFVAVPAVLTAGGLIHCRQWVYMCETCLSEREDTQLRIGWKGASLPLSPRSELQRENSVCLDGWAGAHSHRWHFVGRSQRPEGLLELYERRWAFRAFMRTKRDRGEVSRETFMAVLATTYREVCLVSPDPERARCAALFDEWREECDRQPRPLTRR
jgi:hypothetical protein